MCARLHRVAVGPLQLISSGRDDGAVEDPAAPKMAIPVQLDEGEVRAVTECELRAIAQLLPDERDYTQLADIQRAVTLKRNSGKTTTAKGRGQGSSVGAIFGPSQLLRAKRWLWASMEMTILCSCTGKRRRMDGELSEKGGVASDTGQPRLSIGAAFWTLRRLQRELVEGSSKEQRSEVEQQKEEAAVASLDVLLTEMCDVKVSATQTTALKSELATLRARFPDMPVASRFLHAIRTKAFEHKS